MSPWFSRGDGVLGRQDGGVHGQQGSLPHGLVQLLDAEEAILCLVSPFLGDCCLFLEVPLRAIIGGSLGSHAPRQRLCSGRNQFCIHGSCTRLCSPLPESVRASPVVFTSSGRRPSSFDEPLSGRSDSLLLDPVWLIQLALRLWDWVPRGEKLPEIAELARRANASANEKECNFSSCSGSSLPLYLGLGIWFGL